MVRGSSPQPLVIIFLACSVQRSSSVNVPACLLDPMFPAGHGQSPGSVGATSVVKLLGSAPAASFMWLIHLSLGFPSTTLA